VRGLDADLNYLYGRIFFGTVTTPQHFYKFYRFLTTVYPRLTIACEIKSVGVTPLGQLDVTATFILLTTQGIHPER
jgi:hypothetical protein